MGCNSEEMRTAGPVLISDGKETEIRFVEKRSGWRVWSLRFALEIAGGELSQFGVNERDQMI